MRKIIKLLKSSGAFVIYIWLATTIIGLLSWSYTSSMTKSTFKSDLKIDRWMDRIC